MGKHTAQLIEHRLISEGAPEYVLLRILKVRPVAGKTTLSGKVILLPVSPVAEHTVRFVYLLEFFFGTLLVARVGIRMVFESKFPEGPWCKTGDWVIFARYAGSRFKIDGGEVRIINDDEILATINDPEDILSL